MEVFLVFSQDRITYSMTAEQIVDNPVPRRGFDEGLQGFPPRTEYSNEFGADR